MESEPQTLRHRPYEDIQALITGTLFVSLGVAFFVINLPFYGLVLYLQERFGWRAGRYMAM